MRLEHIASLTGAKLLNRPFISYILNIVTDVKQVQKEDLFISKNKDEVAKAILNGAYAVISSYPDIIDEEVAHFYIDNPKLAIIKLIRFYIIKNKIEVIFSNEITIKLLASFKKDETIYVLRDLENIDFIKLQRASQVFIYSYELLESLNIGYESLSDIHPLRFVTTRFFENNIVVGGVIFRNIKLSYLFETELSLALAFCKKHDINYNLEKIHLKNNFEPIFINRFNQLTTEAKSARVIICEESLEYFKKEELFLQEKAKHLKFKSFEKCDKITFVYDFLLLNCKKDDIVRKLSINENRENSLF